jgi:hypothetical protein
MLQQSSLTAALAQLRYRRVKPWVYQAEWSSEIEHFLYFQLVGRPALFISAMFGLRDVAAEAFAHRSIKTYGTDLQRTYGHLIEPEHCMTHYSVGNLASWRPNASLDMSATSGPILAEKIKSDIERFLFPVIREVTTPDRLMALLLADEKPCLWKLTNGAMRAAMIVYLAQRAGWASADVRRRLEPYKEIISWPIRDGRVADPDAYIDRIIVDAESAVKSAKP